MNDKISIIVPCYNIESFVTKTIKSICEQTYRNIEIILVDDGSSDNTLKILDSLSIKDERIAVIHQSNGGVSKARLTGVEASTGEWIGFVDGDDYIEPDMYEHLLKNAYEHHADISHCGYQMVFPSRVDYYYNTGRLAEQDNFTGLKDLLDGSFIEPGLWNKLFHKSLFHSLLHDTLMDLSIKNMEDLLMNYYLFKQSRKSVYEDFCPYHYMIRRGSAATSNLNEHKLGDPLKVYQRIDQLEKENEELHFILTNRIIRTLIGIATLPLGNQADLIRPYRLKARKGLRSRLHSILSGKFSLKLKMMTLWAVISPTSYCHAHFVYAKLSGTDNKYKVS